MSDFKETNLIVQSNQLIQQTNWELNAVPLKVFKVLVSCIDTKNPPKDNIVTISKKHLYDMVGGDEDTNYTSLKEKTRSLQRTSIRIVSSPTREVYVSLVNWIEWEKNSDIIRCEFHRELMPHIINLKERFTQYPVGNLHAFNSKYGVIIYEFLKAEQYKTFDSYKNTILIDDLRRLTGTTKKYSAFKDFETYVLKVAKDEINSNCLEFLIDYDKIKSGRKISAIKFKTRSRNTYKEQDFNEVLKLAVVDNPFTYENDDCGVAEGQTTIDDF